MVGAVAEETLRLQADPRAVLVVDGEPDTSRSALDAVRACGASGIIARRGSAALGLAREHRPDAVVLSGDAARAEAVLAQLKKHPDTRHLPVVMVGDSAARIDALRAGAAVFLDAPAEQGQLEDALRRLERASQRTTRRIALAAHEGELDPELVRLLSSEGAQLGWVDPTAAAETLERDQFDLAIVVVGTLRREALALLRVITTDEALRERPVIAFVPGELPKTERARLDALAKAAVITVADSPERLIDRATLFLHQVEAQLPAPTRKVLEQLRTGDAPLHGKKVLVIDDDIRNVFALTSTLEQRGMKVVFAENGREGIERLHQHPNTDLVLLDIMMPEMDGYETARAIRATARFESLPIISLTAKAMKGDREKAIAAGASDYIAKPVDVDQLVSMIRVWLDA
jgi:CheY-like chemotaxis protein